MSSERRDSEGRTGKPKSGADIPWAARRPGERYFPVDEPLPEHIIVPEAEAAEAERLRIAEQLRAASTSGDQESDS